MGAQVESVVLQKLDIAPCSGDLHCWFTKPGQCIHRDDMSRLYTQLSGADVLVLATPMYSPLPGEMQNAINRLTPLLEPELEERNGRTRLHFRRDVNIKRIALVAASGWWELENLSTVRTIAEELAADAGVPFAGAVLRPHAYRMAEDPDVEGRVMLAAHRAGVELVRDGVISPETAAEAAVPVVPADLLRRELNAMYHAAKRKTRSDA